MYDSMFMYNIRIQFFLDESLIVAFIDNDLRMAIRQWTTGLNSKLEYFTSTYGCQICGDTFIYA